MNRTFQFQIFTLANDHFIAWPSNVTLTFKLPKQMFQMNNCAKLFWNSCKKLRFLAWTSSDNLLLFYHLTIKCDIDLQPTWTNVSNGTSIILNPCINVEVMARTSSIYDHVIIWPSSVSLTFNLPEQMFQMALLLLKEILCKIILKSMHKYRNYGPDKLSLWPFYDLTFKCDLDLQQTPKNVSNGTSSPRGQHLCRIILKSMHKCTTYGPDKS